jgi:hypothetical protein
VFFVRHFHVLKLPEAARELGVVDTFIKAGGSAPSHCNPWSLLI